MADGQSFFHGVRAGSGLAVHVIPAPDVEENYMYMIVCEATKQAAVVDPVEPEKMLAAAQKLGVNITTVLTTHNHWDHAGGNSKMLSLVPGLVVCGGRGDDAEAVTREVDEDDVISVGNLNVLVIETPCHTQGHVCYYVDGQAVFTGDTMFVAGCGHFFKGTPKMMHDAFMKLGSLPNDTLVYGGHEYTKPNLDYAAFVEPDNKRIRGKRLWTVQTLAAGGVTVPSTIGEEKQTNPFLRAVLAEPTVLQHCGTEDPVEAIKFVREEKTAGRWKDKVPALA